MAKVLEMTEDWKTYSIRGYMSKEETDEVEEFSELSLPPEELKDFVRKVNFFVATRTCGGFTKAQESKALKDVADMLTTNAIIFSIAHRAFCERKVEKK
jgi:hypothetical protein